MFSHIITWFSLMTVGTPEDEKAFFNKDKLYIGVKECECSSVETQFPANLALSVLHNPPGTMSWLQTNMNDFI